MSQIGPFASKTLSISLSSRRIGHNSFCVLVRHKWALPILPARTFKTSLLAQVRSDGGGNDDSDADDSDNEDELQKLLEEDSGLGPIPEKKYEGKWAAENEHYDRLAKVFVWEYRSKHPPRPMLPDELKEDMYRKHKSDPKGWDVDNLSVYAGVSKARAKAILLLMEMRDEARRHGEVFDDALVKALEKEFGVVGTLSDKRDVETISHSGRPPGVGVPLDEDAIERDGQLYDHAVSIRMARASQVPQNELPPQPPKAPDGSELPQAQSYILREPLPTQPLATRGFVVMDNFRGSLGRRPFDNAKRLIYISEPDGTLRTPTWEERRRLTSKPRAFGHRTRMRFEKDDE